MLALFAQHCVKCFRIRSFCGPYILAFRLNTDRKSSEYESISRIANKPAAAKKATLQKRIRVDYLVCQ